MLTKDSKILSIIELAWILKKCYSILFGGKEIVQTALIREVEEEIKQRVNTEGKISPYPKNSIICNTVLITEDLMSLSQTKYVYT